MNEIRQKFEATVKDLSETLDNLRPGTGPGVGVLLMMAWDEAYSAGMRAGEIARTERSDKDYAIEHAEYLAKAVEHYQATKNAFAEFMESADRDRDEEMIDQFRSDLSESWRGMNFCIYEFRKRAKRALPAAPEEKK